MEIPKSYVQVLMVGGAVHDISESQWELLRLEIKAHEWLFVEYLIRGHYVTSVHFWTEESGANYHSAHSDDEVDGETYD